MQLFINNWSAVLTGPATASAVSLSVPLADAAKLTGLGGGDHYLLTLAALDGAGIETAWEIVKVTAVVAGVLTVQRAQEGTAARDWVSASVISARATKGTLEALAVASGAGDLWPYRVSVEDQDQSNSNPALPTCRYGKLGAASLDGAGLTGVNVYRFIPHRDLRIGRMTFNISVAGGSASDKVSAVIYDATADGWPHALIAKTGVEGLAFSRYGGLILGGPINLKAGKVYWVGTHLQVSGGLTVSAVTCQAAEEFVAWYLHGPWSTGALFGEFTLPPGETPSLWSAGLSETGVSLGDIPAVGVCESLT